jgi:CheY-like chemotaxis protein
MSETIMDASGADPVTILIVDDDEGHCELIRRNLRRAAVRNPVVVQHTGEAALAQLRACAAGDGRGEAPPLLVLLDINMPGEINGVDALRLLKSDPLLRALPVIMLTTTDDPREIARCYDLGCSAYVTKPIDPAVFVEAIRRIGLFVEVIRVAPLAPAGAPAGASAGASSGADPGAFLGAASAEEVAA